MKKVFSFLFKTILLLIICLVVKTGYDSIKTIIYPLRYENHIIEYANEYRLDKNLVMGLIKAESNYIHDAHSGKARGLMQITDDTALWLANKMNIDFKTDDVENPEININMGCYYLRYLIDNYNGNIDVALAAYNGGMGNVSKWLENKDYSKDGKSLDYIPFEETREYVKKVNRYKTIYESIY